MNIAEQIIRLKTDFDEVYEAGKEAKKQELWDGLQMGGERKYYNYFLYENKMIDKWFYPKHSLDGTNFSNFARMCGTSTGEALDFAKRLEECGVELDLQNATDVTYLFYQANISRVPKLDFKSTKDSSMYPMFSPAVITIDKIVAYENNKFTNTFSYASNLENVEFEGVIASNISFEYCSRLSGDSIDSIINALLPIPEGGAALSIKFHTDIVLTPEQIETIEVTKGWDLAE